MDVLITENITGTAIESLGREFDVQVLPDLWDDPPRLQALAGQARALIVRNQTQVTQDLLASAPQLEVIGRAGAGLDNIDVSAATANGTVVTYAPHENSISVAELTIGLILSLARQIPAADKDTRHGGWDRKRFTGAEVFGKTLGVIGLGRIGTLVAQRAKAFGMNIVAHDDYVDPEAPRVQELNARLVTLESLAEQADVVVVHVPLSADTRAMINARVLQRMRAHALLINTSRGEVIDEAALIAALRERRIAGAALDVRNVEPPGRDELSSLENVILTPHIAAFTHEAQERVVTVVCQDVATVLAGGAAQNAFNYPDARSGEQ